MKMRKIIATFVALLLCVGIVACAKKTVLSLDLTDDPSGVKVVADGPGTKDSVFSGGAITVAEGEELVITPNFTKGSVTLVIGTESWENKVFDDKVEGVGTYSVEAEPGTYDVQVTGTDDGAVGDLTVSAQAAE